VKPLKVMLAEYAGIEQRVEAVIAEKFGIDFRREAEIVREIDHAMLICERRQLFSADNVIWTGENEVRKLSIKLSRLEPELAECLFLQQAKMIGVKA
jgi:hypothetical protein